MPRHVLVPIWMTGSLKQIPEDSLDFDSEPSVLSPQQVVDGTRQQTGLLRTDARQIRRITSERWAEIHWQPAFRDS
jgi:hypothetical protein